MNPAEKDTRLSRAIRRGLLPGALVLGGGLAASAAIAAEKGANAPPPPTFGMNAAVVRLDVVVRDKHGRVVRDLLATDFEVFEDGAAQSLESFRVFSKGEAHSTRAAKAGEPAEPAGDGLAAAAEKPVDGQPSVVAFVFDRMSPEARSLSRRAAVAHLSAGEVRGCLVGVFSIDLALHVMEPFTTDPERVRAGLERAARQASPPFSEDATESRRRMDTILDRTERLALMSSGGQENPAVAGSAATLSVRNVADTIAVNQQRATGLLERDQQGFATTNALLGVIQLLERAPGRKAIVLLSEGLKVPATVQDRFRAVIAAANRAQVSIYALDTGGLRVSSPLDEANQELSQLNRMRVMDATNSLRLAAGPLMKGLERGEELQTQDPRSRLGELAEETGGLLVHDSNDATAGFGQIGEDLRFHYLLAYAPTNQKLDGTLRQVSVRVRRPRLSVQTRKSYVALPSSAPNPSSGPESEVLAQLDRRPTPSAIAVRMIALSFPEVRRPGLVPVLVEVPEAAFHYAPTAGGEPRADVTIAVRIKNERQEEVATLSDRYLIPPGDPAAPRRPLRFYREVDIPPGRYTVETAAYDAGSHTAGATERTLEVPAVSEGELRLSSLVLARGVEPASAVAASGRHPLQFGEAFLYPNLGEPLHKSASPQVGFFFTAYGDPQAPATREAVLELRRGDRKLRSARTELPPLDAEGRVQHAGTLSLEGLEPGAYTLAVTVSDGRRSDTQRAAFVLEP